MNKNIIILLIVACYSKTINNKDKNHELSKAIYELVDLNGKNKEDYLKKFEIVKQILKKENIDTNYFTYFRIYSPLMLAAEKGDIELSKLLIEKGADVNLKNYSGDTAYSRALSKRRGEVLHLLATSGVSISNEDLLNHVIYCNSNIELFKMVLTNVKTVTYELLKTALENKNIEIITLLLEKPIDINLKYNFGLIEESIRTKSIKIITLFLEKFIDIDLKYHFELIAASIRTKSIEITKLLMDKFNIEPSLETKLLSIAIETYDIDIIELILEKYHNIDFKSEEVNVMLKELSERVSSQNIGTEEILIKLLAKGANIDFKYDNDYTLLMYAIEEIMDLELAEILINAGASLNIKDAIGRTPLMLAAEWNKPKLVKLILSKGTEVNVKDKEGKTALMFLIFSFDSIGVEEIEDYKEDFEETLELLITNGANLNIRDNENEKLVDTIKATLIKVFNNSIGVDNIKTWKLAAALLSNFNIESTDEKLIGNLKATMSSMKEYYDSLEDYNFFNLQSAVLKLRSPLLFNFDDNLKNFYIEFLKSVVVYIARVSENMLNEDIKSKKMKFDENETKKRIEEKNKIGEHIERIKRIFEYVKVITEKEDGIVRIKEKLPQDTFTAIAEFF